jgi:hypothetical protein
VAIAPQYTKFSKVKSLFQRNTNIVLFVKNLPSEPLLPLKQGITPIEILNALNRRFFKDKFLKINDIQILFVAIALRYTKKFVAIFIKYTNVLLYTKICKFLGIA